MLGSFLFLGALLATVGAGTLDGLSNFNLINKQGCGLGSPHKVPGQEQSYTTPYPWLVAVAFKKADKYTYTCPGTLITSKYVLVAGHCLTKSIDRVRFGKHESIGECQVTDTDDCSSATTLYYNVKRTIRHPDISNKKNFNDVALVELEFPVNVQNNANTICLPIEDEGFEGKNIKAVGWPYEFVAPLSRFSSEVLTVDNFPITPLAECNVAYAKFNKVIDGRQVCGGGGDTTCTSKNTVGPLVGLSSPGDQGYTQYGVQSFGPARCESEVPVVYSSVFKFMPWILENITP